ncbi:DNA methyltransferase 1-associated protein 1 [Xylographa trunciseda]|nr:DNA methyltransferase 1-associated protein 1 [Xylographa trunciseda]
MASTLDARDILDAKQEDRPRHVKKQKTGIVRPKGANRELFGLYGDRAAPVVIEQPTYRARPKWTHKVLPWEQTPFVNPARTDGLVLRHWRKKKNVIATTPGAPNTPADLKTEHDSDSRSTQTEPDYHFAKFNVKVTGPEYNDEQYEAYLKNDDWTKEETDYLIQLAVDFDLRWIVVADRYEYQAEEIPSDGDSMAVTVTPKARTMEDMKARYYDVAAKVMVLRHPLSSMSTTEFDLHEKMIKFDPTQETTRKKLAEALLSRSPEEIREEEILLGELKRIVVAEERFALERKELYDRLQAPQSTASIQNYESSQGLANLMQTLLSVDKNKKQRRTLTGPGDGASSPATGGSSQNLAGPGSRDQRNSIGGSAVKKGLSGSSSQRQLTPREEAKFGVSHHERLTSGVTLRGYRIDKLLQAKSQAQSKKLDDALRELGVPHKAVMPTTKVCDAYELLVQKINILLEVRKVSDKVDNEIKVQQAQREYREKKESGEEAATPQASSPAAEPDGEGEVEPESRREVDEEDDDDEDAEGEVEDAEGEVEDVEGEVEDAEENAEGPGKDSDEDEDGDDDGDAEVDEEKGLEEEEEGEEQEAGDESGDNNSEEDEEDAEGDVAEDDEVDDSRLSAAPSNKSGITHKRSASELSAASEKSSKRQKK